jgi:alkyl sulfatase BDS1-like metallo-beta-lactamase superfamily hydrolase
MAVVGSAAAQQEKGDRAYNNDAIFRLGEDQTEPLEYAGCIYKAIGFGHTFMVTTDEGNVIIDTSSKTVAPRHEKLLREVSDAPIRHIVVTHAHTDHNGGIAVWKGENTEVIAHRMYRDFRNYMHRLAGFFVRRNAAQYTGSAEQISKIAELQKNMDRDFGNYGAPDDGVTRFIDDEYAFELGGLTFRVFHTPGETPDMLSVWIPELKALFSGDNFLKSFPNIYTLRGTRPRWALDFVESIDKYIALEPELLLASHNDVLVGNEQISRQMARRRDAILYVHDATVRGMNQGKDVHTLMGEVRLPEGLADTETYGNVSWSVRGIYEGYVGWFDGNPASMYATPASAMYPDLVELAGGPDRVAARATVLIEEGRILEGLRMTDAALEAAPDNAAAWKARLAALTTLEQKCSNSNERGWLLHGIREAEYHLGQ